MLAYIAKHRCVGPNTILITLYRTGLIGPVRLPPLILVSVSLEVFFSGRTSKELASGLPPPDS